MRGLLRDSGGFRQPLLALSSLFRDLFWGLFGILFDSLLGGLFGRLLHGLLGRLLGALHGLFGGFRGSCGLLGCFRWLFRRLGLLGPLFGGRRFCRAPSVALGLDRPERQELAVDSAGHLVDGHHPVVG